jgi:hypothetical protein
MFERFIDLTEPICQDINSKLASMTIFDPSGIEAYVQENHPKFINTLIGRLKAWKAVKKLDDSFIPCRLTLKLTPPSNKCISMGTSAIPTNSV